MAKRKSYLVYSTILRNEYLSVSKELKARSSLELNLKIEDQKRKWAEQETRQREKERTSDLKTESEYMNKQAEENQKKYGEILRAISNAKDIPSWDSMMQHKPFMEF